MIFLLFIYLKIDYQIMETSGKYSKDIIRRYYCRWIYDNNVYEECVYVPVGKNIVDMIISTSGERKSFVVICIREVELCDGCYLEKGGQNEHMECPYGCLHDKSECDFCKE